MHDIVSNHNQKVFVHCTSGISRAPTIGALYLCIFERMKVDEAIESIKKFFPIAHPNQEIIKQALLQF
jgi:protein-tyrosine phosphatase